LGTSISIARTHRIRILPARLCLNHHEADEKRNTDGFRRSCFFRARSDTAPHWFADELRGKTKLRFWNSKCIPTAVVDDDGITISRALFRLNDQCHLRDLTEVIHVLYSIKQLQNEE